MPHKSRAHRAPTSPKRTNRARAAFRRTLKRDPGQAGPVVSVTPVKLPPLDRGALPHFWYPERDGVVRPPAAFAERLAAVHPDLRLTRPPVRSACKPNCWLLWVKQPRITHSLCPGWQLLMAWQVRGIALGLDETLFAAIAHFDRRHLGENALQYFDRIIRERDREKEKREKSYLTSLTDDAKDFMDSTKIKNIGRGNKFARHHDGTVIPSRGERNWQAELDRNLPKRVRLDMERRADS